MTNAHTSSYSRRLLPPISALMAFDAAARTGSFTLAANELSLSQGAVSRQILALEDSLGLRLFERVRGRVVLTPAGAFYAERVREALAGLAAATAQTMASRGKGGILRLGILPSFGTRWLIPQMPEFFARHHDINVNFISQLPGSIDFALHNLDAAITFGASAWPGARRHKLMGEQLIPVAAPGLVRDLAIRAPRDLARATLLVHASQVDAWPEWFAVHSLDYPKGAPTLSFEQFTMIVPAAAAGLGVALVPAIFVEAELCADALVHLFDGSVLTRPGHDHYLVYPAEKQDYPPLVAFREWLLAKVHAGA
ncbi:MAG: LysR substrate-binding domain-containing protein [Burkholderiales bacterium]